MDALSQPPSRPRLSVGDPAPVFDAMRLDGSSFSSYTAVQGRPVVVFFTGDAGLKPLHAAASVFAGLDETAQLMTFVPGDPATVSAQKAVHPWPYETMADQNGMVSNGFAELSACDTPSVYVLDPNQRIAGIRSLEAPPDDVRSWIDDIVQLVMFQDKPQIVHRAAPALFIPRALEREDCQWLIDLWRNNDTETGQVALGASADKTLDINKTMKRRDDFIVRDAEMEATIASRLMPRVVPEVSKIYHFEGFRIEAFRVGRYGAEDAGFFNIHRDDSNPSTQHRKYAMTLNLNVEDYEGGDLMFPEYGPDLFRPPTGGAVIFSCSMLHEVRPVTKGERFVLLTFLTKEG